MHERLLPASPNWYCSRCSDTNDKGILGFGAKNTIYLVDVTASSCAVVGELVGHRERVSGLSFCHHGGQSHLCASASDDGTVKFWDTDEKVFLKEHKGHQSTITALHWSPVEKNLVVSGDEKGIVVCYRFNTGDSSSFFPEPRNIFSLSCSPHTWNHVAVGYKDGMIVLIDVAKKGEVVHRLRGHDDEIHALAWAPVANEEALYSSRPDDITETTNGESEAAEKGCYLASGSKDQTVRIWSTAKGKGVMTMKLPFLKRRGAGVDPGVRERLWLTVHWPKGKPTQVVSSCFGGELVLWDLTRSGKQRWSLLGASSEGQNHSRIVFNMSSVRLQDHRELLLSTSMDREIKCWDLASLECCWTLPSLGGFVYSLAFSPVATGCLALGVGDSMIRVWNTMGLQNRYDTRLFWQGIKSKVTALAWHPSREASLAFGTDDGKVGIYDVFSTKPPQVSSSYHRKTVYTLAWGPPVPPMGLGAPPGEKVSPSLYSCAGEGLILQHDPWKLAGDASDIDRLIRETNSIKHKLSPHTDLSWKPDGSVVAIGNEDGSIEVYQAPSLRLLVTIQQHHKIINSLRWHHQHSALPHLQYLLASASSNALVYVHDLRTLIESPPAVPVVMTEAYRTLSGHTAKITQLAWSPHHDGRLASACYDGTAQVWDVLKEEAVCNYRGHRGRLLCAQWSPVDPDLVWTGGDDFTAQEWNTAKQQHTAPPKGKKTVELRERSKNKSKAKKKKKEKVSGKGGAMAEEGPSPSLNGGGDKGGGGGGTAAAGEEEEEEEEEEEGSETPSSTSSVAAPPPSVQMDRAPGEKVQNGGRSFSSVKRDQKREKQEVCSQKKRKPRSMLPLSTSMDHRPREDLQLDCLTLAAVANNQALPAHCVPGQGEHIQLGLFSDRQALYRMLREEEQGHVEAGHFESVVYLRLWTGDVAGALQVATETGELSDHLLSVAPMCGYQVWSRAVEAYVKQLCLQEQYLKAASHLLSLHKIYEAIDLLKSHQLYREGIALAKARLQGDDPVLKDLYVAWATLLEKDGHLTTAAKCYLATDSSFDAAKVLAKKNDAASLRAAAGLARASGEDELSHSLALRCAKDLAANQDWLGAQQVLSAQDSLLAHRLHLCTAELLTLRLSVCGVVTWSCSSNNPWALSGEGGGEVPLPQVVKEVWQKEFGVVQEDGETWSSLQRVLRAVETPPPSPNIPAKQLLTHLSLDLTLSWMEVDRQAALKGMWRGVARAREAGLVSLEAELCTLIFPQGVDSLVNYRPLLAPDDDAQEETWGATKSLEALVSYRWLYQCWWSLNAEGRAGQSGSRVSSLQPVSERQGGPARDPETHAQAGDPETHPQAGDPETHPQAGDPETHPQAGDPETHPQAGDPETHPQAGDPETLPQARDPETLPQARDPETHPQAGDPETLPQARDPETHPQAGDPETHPQAGDPETLPQAGEDETHPQVEEDETHPQAREDETHPQAVEDEGGACALQQNGHAESAGGGALASGQDGAERAGECASARPGLCASPECPRHREDVRRRCGAACDVLLSEPHAVYQATQRAIAEIQQRLASLMHQHSRTQGTEPSAVEGQGDTPPTSTTTQETLHPHNQGRTDAAQRSDGESLPSLIAMVTEHHKALADLPDDLKKYPYPDVMECCLVVLHLSRRCRAVCDASQLENAKALLRKHGTTPALRKASRPLLS